LVRLRTELIELHTGFTKLVDLLTLISGRATGAVTSATQTSPVPSAG
jgi:hypothetical protein